MATGGESHPGNGTSSVFSHIMAVSLRNKSWYTVLHHASKKHLCENSPITAKHHTLIPCSPLERSLIYSYSWERTSLLKEQRRCSLHNCLNRCSFLEANCSLVRGWFCDLNTTIQIPGWPETCTRCTLPSVRSALLWERCIRRLSMLIWHMQITWE